ncbi:unnamed protein product [Adineta ricciae]|uniref:Uncharacterized protein n=1 Tax=Adineta ricciae TaxID=249248 RepID=A0A816A4U8_ADIRI|nr:unnamed protein product [Adineta ricciae]CAF1590476.1 unnamed protein product [Adineta ricciae]
MIIFAVHQSNAAATDRKPLLDDTKQSSPLVEKLRARRAAIAAASVDGFDEFGSENIQCGNGVVTITDGNISCAGK